VSHGLVVPVVVWRNQIVDGRHRAKLCQELGIELRTNDITKQCSTEAEMIARVRAFNEHRRTNTKPLKTAEKRRASRQR
jgi:ParB-like chromosome segregation protein Spo0J